jgi:hypothetical protein
MKTYYQNGTVSDIEYIIMDKKQFAIQHETDCIRDLVFYPGDALVREIETELIDLYDRFQDLYFKDSSLFYTEQYNIPVGLAEGGQSSMIAISKDDFLNLRDKVKGSFSNLDRHIYVRDCQYLVSTVQNLIQAVEFCFEQYYIQVGQFNISDELLAISDTYQCSSDQTRQIAFFVEAFFIKLYSILDVIVKIVYELENPVDSFLSMTKLRSSEKVWGDRKNISLNGLVGSIFEDCKLFSQIESLRNEIIHNGTWEFPPKLYVKVEGHEIVERFMLFPDLENGRLATAKNRKRFFHKGTKINDVLVSTHDEFYNRLLFTLKRINSSFAKNNQV